MNKNLFIIVIGVLSLLISIGAWMMDLSGMVEECIYCRGERTITGLLGMVILLPSIKYLRLLLGYIFGFFGAHIAAAQIFLNIKNEHVGMMLLLSCCALCWIIFQVCIIQWFPLHYKKNRLR